MQWQMGNMTLIAYGITTLLAASAAICFWFRRRIDSILARRIFIRTVLSRYSGSSPRALRFGTSSSIHHAAWEKVVPLSDLEDLVDRVFSTKSPWSSQEPH